MGESPASYIRMVHHLIEECILFNMSKEECMEALSKHANIEPVITSTGCFCMHHRRRRRHHQCFVFDVPNSRWTAQRWVFAVWNELEKENKEFFEAYGGRSMRDEEERGSRVETRQRIQKMLSDATTKLHGARHH